MSVKVYQVRKTFFDASRPYVVTAPAYGFHAYGRYETMEAARRRARNLNRAHEKSYPQQHDAHVMREHESRWEGAPK